MTIESVIQELQKSREEAEARWKAALQDKNELIFPNYDIGQAAAYRFALELLKNLDNDK